MDFVAILEIALVLFASGFALLLPLYAYLKDFPVALRVSIPISFSVEILFGYVFYITGTIKFFPIIYLLLVLLINIFFALRLGLFKKAKKIRLKFDWKIAIPVLLAIGSIILLRFYDAALIISPGAIDASAHALYMIDLDIVGKLSFASYPPGFHILIFPVSQITEIVNVYRFSGPVLGVMTILSLYLIYKDLFKNKRMLFFLALGFGLPVFNILTLQTISFFPTALTFIFLPLLVYILMKPRELLEKKSLLFFALTCSALAITVPYLLVQFIAVIVILCGIALVAVKKIGKNYSRFIGKIFLISLLGFALAFGLVYLQNTVSERSDAGNFPQIYIAETEDTGLTVTTNMKESSDLLSRNQWLKDIVAGNEVISDYFIPMAITGGDIIAVKDIRPFSGIVSIVAYFWIAISLIMIYLGIKKSDYVMLVLGSLILLFCTATQTGMFEMSTYRGRSGWYLLLFVMLATIYLLDRLIRRIPGPIFYSIFALLLVASVISPPTFYRGYFEEYFTQARAISRQYPNQKILLVTAERRATAVSKNFTYGRLDSSLMGNDCPYDQCFIMIEDKFFEIDPILSQNALSIDKELQVFRARQATIREEHNRAIELIKNSEYFSKYKLYWQNENISIYQFAK